MGSPNQKQILAKLLGEVKFAEKKLEKEQQKLPALESRIKQALVAGNRDLAKKYALEFEEQKLAVQRAEQAVKIAKQQYEAGKGRATEVAGAERLSKLAQSMNKMADSLDVLNRDDDMLEKIEESVAYAEARLDVALDAARAEHPEIDLPPEPPPPPANTAEDILKEFE